MKDPGVTAPGSLAHSMELEVPLTSVPNEPPARLSGTYTPPDGTPAETAKARRAARDWTWRIADLDPTAKLILMAYADHVRADGQATLGVPRLMELVGVSRRNVQKWLTVLRDRHLITPGDQALVAHLRADQRPTVYRVQYEPLAEVIDLRGVADDASSRGVAPDTPSRGVADDASLSRENEKPRGVANDARVASDAQGCKALGSSTPSLRSVVEEPAPAPKSKRPRKPKTEPTAAEARRAEINSAAKRLADTWCAATGIKTSFMKVRGFAAAMLRAGHTEPAVADAMRAIWRSQGGMPNARRRIYNTEHLEQALTDPGSLTAGGVSSARTRSIDQPLSPTAYEEIDPNGGLR